MWTSTDKYANGSISPSNNKLICRSGVTTVVTRTINGDDMNVEMEVKGVKANASFRRKNL